MHDIIELRTVTQVCKLEPASLTYAIIFQASSNLLKICFNFIAMVAPLVSWALVDPIVMCFEFLFDGEKINNHHSEIIMMKKISS